MEPKQTPFVLSRRALLVGSTLGLLTGAAITSTPGHATPTPTLMTQGQYKGVKYTLLTVQKPNSADHLTNIVGTNDGTFESVGGRPIIRDLISSTQAYALRPSANVLFASNTTNGGRFRGVQVQNSKLYQDFTDPWLNNIFRAHDAYGAQADGEGKIYRYDQHAGADLVADGVVHSFTFGMAVVIDGKPQYFSQHPQYQQMLIRMPNDALMVASARTVVGDDKTGRAMVLVIEGKTGVSGLTLDELADLCYMLGFYDAKSLDSGGSAQLSVHGRMVVSSSDGAERPLPAWGAMENVQVIDALHQDPPASYEATLTTGAFGGAKFTLIHLTDPAAGKALGKMYATDNLKLSSDTGNLSPLGAADFYASSGQSIIFAFDADPTAGSLTGVHIQDGVPIRDFDGHISDGAHALGVGYDGTAQAYDGGRNTLESMVASGVRNTFNFSHQLVKDGSAQAFEGSDATSRLILGSDEQGRVMLLSASNITLTRLGQLAQEIGFHQAYSSAHASSTMLVDGQTVSGVASDRFLSMGYLNSVSITQENQWVEPVPEPEQSYTPAPTPEATPDNPVPTEPVADVEPTGQAIPEPTSAPVEVEASPAASASPTVEPVATVDATPGSSAPATPTANATADADIPPTPRATSSSTPTAAATPGHTGSPAASASVEPPAPGGKLEPDVGTPSIAQRNQPAAVFTPTAWPSPTSTSNLAHTGSDLSGLIVGATTLIGAGAAALGSSVYQGRKVAQEPSDSERQD